jgi:thioredoxin-related protein
MKNVWGILLLMWAGDAKAQIDWLEAQKAFHYAAGDKRKVLFYFYTDWCGWCRLFEQRVLADPQVYSYLNRHFYAVKVNAMGQNDIILGGKRFVFMPEVNAHQLAYQLLGGDMRYPALVVMTADGEVLSPAHGFLDTGTMRLFMAYFAENCYEHVRWDEFTGACH